MSRRKLRIYCDADVDKTTEDALRSFPGVNCDSARQQATTTRPDSDHYRYAAKRHRVLVTHDDDYLNNSRYPIMATDGVIVIKRGESQAAVRYSFWKFVTWFWAPGIRNTKDWPALGYMKVNLSTVGFHYWIRTQGGAMQEDYYTF